MQKKEYPKLDEVRASSKSSRGFQNQILDILIHFLEVMYAFYTHLFSFSYYD